MKNINDLDTSQYSYYVYVNFFGDFDIKVPTLSGWVDVVDGYDIYSISNGSIIAFNSVCLLGYNDIKITQGNEEKFIDLVTYEELKDVFEEKERFGYTFYFFGKSGSISDNSMFKSDTKINGIPIHQSTFARCDLGTYGPVPFVMGDKGHDIKKITNLFNYSGLGHIVRVETKNSESQNPGHHVLYTASRTLEGSIKTIYEWSVAHQPPFNNQEDIAVAAYNYINNIDMPNEILNQILERQPDMSVSQYIQTGLAVQKNSGENRSVSEDLKNFMISKCRYRSLSVLAKRHPMLPDIPDSVLVQEKIEAEETLFQYCYLNGINIDNTSLLDLGEYIQTEFPRSQTLFKINPLDAVERLL